MITNHKVSNNVLYIYFDFSYEIGKFGYIKEEDIFFKILNYIKEKKIKFNGKKVMLCASGVVFASLMFMPQTNDINLEYKNIEVVEKVLEETKKEDIKEEIKIGNLLDEKNSNIQVNKEEIKVENKLPQNTNTTAQKNTYNKNNNLKENVNSNINNVSDNKKENEVKYINPVTIYRKNGQVVTLELEEYLIGVVAAEMPASFNIEALKAQAIASRTYTLKYVSEGKKLTDTEATQSYQNIEELKIKWGTEFDKYYKKIETAVKSTEGIYMTYNGKYIDAVYHASNNGYTVSSNNVWGNDIAYLNSVESSWDINSSSYLRNKSFTLDDFSKKLGIDFNLESTVEIKKDKTNHVENIIIDEISFTGIEFRQKLGLRSTDFDIEVKEESIIITTRGYGHGVGMSQYGANGMANSGYNYLDILKHYYNGISIKK